MIWLWACSSVSYELILTSNHALAATSTLGMSSAGPASRQTIKTAADSQCKIHNSRPLDVVQSIQIFTTITSSYN